MATSLDLSLLTTGQSQGYNRESQDTGLTSLLGSRQEQTSTNLDSTQSPKNNPEQENSFYNTLDKKLKQDKSRSSKTTDKGSQVQEDGTDDPQEQSEAPASVDLTAVTPITLEAPETMTSEDLVGFEAIESLPEIPTAEAVISTDIVAQNPLPELRQTLTEGLSNPATPLDLAQQTLAANAQPQQNKSTNASSLPTDGLLEQVETAINESGPVNAEALTQAVAQAQPDTNAIPDVKGSSLTELHTEDETSSLPEALLAKMERTLESDQSLTAEAALAGVKAEASPSTQEDLSNLKQMVQQQTPTEAPEQPELREMVQTKMSPTTSESVTTTQPQTELDTSALSGEGTTVEVQPSTQPSVLTDPTPLVEASVAEPRMGETPNPARSVSQQILESVQSSLQTEDKSITINLTPPELGRVTIRFQESSDGLQGELELSRQETRHDVERALPQILQSLQANGIQVRKMEVNVNVGDQSESQTQQELLDQETRDSQQQQERWNQQDNILGGQSAPSDETSARRSASTSGSVVSGYESSFDTDSIDMLV